MTTLYTYKIPDRPDPLFRGYFCATSNYVHWNGVETKRHGLAVVRYMLMALLCVPSKAVDKYEKKVLDQQKNQYRTDLGLIICQELYFEL